MIIPLKRSVHSPEHTARGVMVGLFWAFTPTVGIQMPLVLVTWIAARKLFRWDFSMITGLAWTWVTNVLTMGPAYYVFYVTGQFMLGRLDAVTGYAGFLDLWRPAFSAHVGGGVFGGFEWFRFYLVEVVRGWGLAMAVGCIPWAIVAGWLGYAWSLRFVRRYREARHRRRLARLAAGAAPSRVSRFLHEHDPFHRRDGETG